MTDDLYDGPCVAGCMHFHGRETKHHKDCGHYPESLTKYYADRIEELEAERDEALNQFDSARHSAARAALQDTATDTVPKT